MTAKEKITLHWNMHKFRWLWEIIVGVCEGQHVTDILSKGGNLVFESLLYFKNTQFEDSYSTNLNHRQYTLLTKMKQEEFVS